jgi:predicted metalloprotease
MRWGDLRQSENVEDRRGGGRGLAVGGGIGSVIIAVIVYLLGGDPSSIPVPQGGSPGTSATSQQYEQPGDDSLRRFVSAVLGSTEDIWKKKFQEMGRSYTDPKLVLFTSQVQSACGIAGAAVGPFYCPGDSRVYIDLAFYRELRDRFHAPGDFAQAYVIAHEVGHHVQNLLGISDRVTAQQRRAGRTGANELSVRLELQADFYAGVWAHYAQQQGVLDVGDVDEALNAASAIGDDKLQQESQGYVVPDAFTHGTSAQRARWFKRGLETGDVNAGDTFSADPL